MKQDNELIKRGRVFVGFILTFIVGLGAGSILFTSSSEEHFMRMTMADKRGEVISEKETIIRELINEGKYACCLEKPCMYCIEKTPGHGEGAECNCLGDVVAGVHPCGECIGEILEGHGNRFLAPYFAAAITEEVGEQHKDTIRQIISEKYGISIEKQI